uniref:Ubiquitin-like domain-containing protein n=1 Tax=Acrobeloides nanus TaxID=290746 RepID=A0A914EP93_9BILA
MYGEPANPKHLWEEFKKNFAEDFIHIAQRNADRRMKKWQSPTTEKIEQKNLPSEQMITLFIHLHDHEESLHKKTYFKFSNEATVENLKKEISSLWQFDERHQELYYNGDQINDPNSTLQKIGIKSKDTIIVKHIRWENWRQFTKMVEIAREAIKGKQEHKTKEAIDLAINQTKGLKEAKFFLAYPALLDIFTSFNKEFAPYVDADRAYMDRAAQDYFSMLFNDNPELPTVKSMCNPNPNSGAQSGLICRVTKDGVDVGSYYVKTHLSLSLRSSSSHQHADLREIFVYRLLQLIKVGPVVHFLPDVHHSTLGLYIATQEVPGFRTAAEVKMECLYLTDLHTSNYGLDINGKLCIVDFQIGSHAGSGKSALQEYLKGQKKLRSQVGKDCFRDYGFSKTVDEADKRITFQKKLFEQKPIYFNVSENYRQYFIKVKDNIKIFSEYFNNAD